MIASGQSDSRISDERLVRIILSDARGSPPSTANRALTTEEAITGCACASYPQHRKFFTEVPTLDMPAERVLARAAWNVIGREDA